MTASNKQLLILDLDETLVYATENPLDRSFDFIAGQYLVYKRPFLNAFLKACAPWFEMAVWTSSSEDYAEAIIQEIFPPSLELSFVWARQHCTQAFDPHAGKQFWIKDLKKLKRKGYRLEQIIFVDDSPEKLMRNYGNLIRVKPFLGDLEDQELSLLIPFLKHLRTADDVRKLEKRSWRERSQGNLHQLAIHKAMPIQQRREADTLLSHL